MTIGPMLAVGTSRHFAVVPNDGRDRSEADMPRASRPCGSDQNDPLLPFAAQGFCIAQLDLGTLFRRAGLA